jgi:hypothetical protein
MLLLHDERFHPHFHKEHVVNISKFQHGYKTYCKNLLKEKEKQGISDWGIDVNEEIDFDNSEFTDENWELEDEDDIFYDMDGDNDEFMSDD